MVSVARASAADLPNITDALASAFSFDPMFQWIVGVDRTTSIEPTLRRLFRAMGRAEFSTTDPLVFTVDGNAAAAVWKHPGAWKMSAGTMVRILPAMLRALSTKTPKMIGALGAIEKVHPPEEHYYLEALGTRFDKQGTGVGSVLIRDMLDRCDAEGMPAYLESSNPQNVPFYGRHGFEVTGEIEIGKGAPVVTAMWRRPH